MSSVPTAAFDPAFWFHHCNIDRLWSRWDALPDRKWGNVPPASWFQEKPWSFHDADGSVTNHPRLHWLKYRQLGIEYDDDVKKEKRLSDNLPPGMESPSMRLGTNGLMAEMSETKSLSATNVVTFRVSGDSSAVNSEAMKRLTAPRAPAPPRIVLEMRYTAPASLPNVNYSVFLSAADDSAPDTDAERRIGQLNLFGARHIHGGHSAEHDGGDAHANKALIQSFDISRFAEKDGFNPAKVSVSVRPLSLFAAATDRKRTVHVARHSGDIVVHSVSIRVK